MNKISSPFKWLYQVTRKVDKYNSMLESCKGREVNCGIISLGKWFHTLITLRTQVESKVVTVTSNKPKSSSFDSRWWRRLYVRGCVQFRAAEFTGRWSAVVSESCCVTTVQVSTSAAAAAATSTDLPQQLPATGAPPPRRYRRLPDTGVPGRCPLSGRSVRRSVSVSAGHLVDIPRSVASGARRRRQLSFVGVGDGDVLVIATRQVCNTHAERWARPGAYGRGGTAASPPQLMHDSPHLAILLCQERPFYFKYQAKGNTTDMP